jgi:hypothetical protein
MGGFNVLDNDNVVVLYKPIPLYLFNPQRLSETQ